MAVAVVFAVADGSRRGRRGCGGVGVLLVLAGLKFAAAAGVETTREQLPRRTQAGARAPVARAPAEPG